MLEAQLQHKKLSVGNLPPQVENQVLHLKAWAHRNVELAHISMVFSKEV